MTIDVLIIHCYKTAVFFANYSILPSSWCSCTNIYYVTVIIESCPCVLCLATLKCACRLRAFLCVVCVLVGFCVGCELAEDSDRPKHVAARW